MSKINYTDKEFLNKNEEIADNRKVNDTDLNEIKQVVNTNDDNIGDLSNLNTTDKSSIVGAINEIKKKNILTAGMVQQRTTINGSSNQVQLKVEQSVGNEITLSDSVITISNNIKKVKVSAQTNIQMANAGSVYGAIRIKATPGGTVLATSANASTVEMYNFLEMNITPKIIDVSTNKQLWLDVGISKQGDMFNDENGNTFITVEEVE